MKRRSFLKGCCAAAGAASLPAAAFFNPAMAGAGSGHDVLVYLYLRGGIDGLHLVVPYAGPERTAYEARRGNMLIPEAHLRPISAQWALHPRAGGGPGDPVGSTPRWLQRLWLQDKLAIVQGAGMPTHLSRSHFDAQAWMDLGTPGNKTTAQGWLARYLSQATGLPPALLSHAFGFSSTQPLALIGANDAFTVSNAQEFRVDGFHWSWNSSNPDIAGHVGAHRRIQPLWQGGSSPLDQAGRLTAEALAEMRSMNFEDYEPEGGAAYPSSNLGTQLRNLAQLIKEDTGVVAATLDYGGWDTHQGQGMPNPGNPNHFDYYGNLVQGMAEALDAFYTDLSMSAQGDLMNRVSVVVLSEFGRNVTGNQSNGTDHGYGNVMLALGGRVNGGQFFGEFPGLDKSSLFENQDLDTSVDYRQVLAEALVRRHGMSQGQLEQVFPALDGYQPLGIFQAS
ncbi:MAG: DUF1501 domain-containing protein [Wenzhouxiangella sp.]|nr:MAG: DUF1501 domain-containing protein [Wenzhouxiangella sp.]